MYTCGLQIIHKVAVLAYISTKSEIPELMELYYEKQKLKNTKNK